jgi:FMN phosphatase YigB (HAD superfamily)
METARSKGLLTAEQRVLCKPNKQAFQLVLEQLGVSPASTIFIDDSMRNVAAAHELGIFTVLVSPSLAVQQSPHQQVAGADLVVSGFNQLREVLPQVFVAAQPRMSEDVPAAAPVAVSVMAA